MDAEIIGKKECVDYVGRLEGIWTIRPTLGGRGDRACTEPMGIESSKNSHFQGQQCKTCR